MTEPNKSDIDAIFKRLRTIPANKVCQSFFIMIRSIFVLIDVFRL
jgi:hypothetical protein